jgi:hypothetical protein
MLYYINIGNKPARASFALVTGLFHFKVNRFCSASLFGLTHSLTGAARVKLRLRNRMIKKMFMFVLLLQGKWDAFILFILETESDKFNGCSFAEQNKESLSSSVYF